PSAHLARSRAVLTVLMPVRIYPVPGLQVAISTLPALALGLVCLGETGHGSALARRRKRRPTRRAAAARAAGGPSSPARAGRDSPGRLPTTRRPSGTAEHLSPGRSAHVPLRCRTAVGERDDPEILALHARARERSTSGFCTLLDRLPPAGGEVGRTPS